MSSNLKIKDLGRVSSITLDKFQQVSVLHFFTGDFELLDRNLRPIIKIEGLGLHRKYSFIKKLMKIIL